MNDKLVSFMNIDELISLIDREMGLSDYGNNTYDLDGLYYELYLKVRRSRMNQ
jgi:hypothetical protein